MAYSVGSDERAIEGMKKLKSLVVICAVSVCSLSLSLLKKESAPTPYEFSSSAGAITAPFELTKNCIFLAVHVKGSARLLWFALDSGSGSTYMDAGIARSLELQANGTGTVHGAGAGEVPIQNLQSVTFELSGLEASVHSMKVTDLKGLDQQYGREIDGFFGHDFLDRYVIAVDYNGRQITIYDPSRFRYAGTGQSMTIHFRHNWPYVDGTIKVKGLAPQEAEFLVDSGSGDAVDDPAILKSKARLRKVQTGVGLGTAIEGALGRAEYLALGKYRLSGPITSCCSANPDDQHKIGGEVLRRFTVIFDYPHSRIILEPNRHFHEPFPDA
jgi:Aspartyl protease